MKRILFLLILVLPILSWAKEYTLDDLINIGLEKSLYVKQENVNYKNTASSLNSSYLSLLPSFNVNANKSNSDGEWNNASGGLGLNENLSLNESRYFSIRRAINNQKNSELSLQNTHKQIAYTIFSKYLNILESQKSLNIQQENLKLQKKIHNQIQVQFDAGNKSLLDLKQSEITLIDYEISVNEAENNLEQLRKDLFSYLNIEDKHWNFSEPEFSIKKIDNLYQENYSLKMERNSLKNSKLSLFQQKLDFFPTLSVGFNYNYNSNLGSDILDLQKYDASYFISLSASYSIFDIWDKRESYKRSKRNLDFQKLNLEDSERKNKDKFENLKKDIITLQKSLNLYSKKLKLSKENLEMAQEQYKLGIISLLDLDRSNIDYFSAQLSNNNKYYELIRKQEEMNLLLSQKILGKW